MAAPKALRAAVAAAALMLPVSAYAAGADTLWTRTYEPGLRWSDVRAVERTSDGCFVIMGMWVSEFEGPYGTYLMKVEDSGDTLWMARYLDIRGQAIDETSDGGYAIVADNSVYCADICFWRIDAEGDTLWTREYSWSHPDLPYIASCASSIEQTADGGFMILGTTQSSPPWGTGTDAVLIRTDAGGDTLWTRRHLWRGSDIAGVHPCFGHLTPDGGYLIVGHTNLHGAEEDDIYIIRTDENGDSLWTRTYAGPDRETAISVIHDVNGGYTILGRRTTYPPRLNRPYLIRMDENGDTLWTRTYGTGGESITALCQCEEDGGYVLVGGVETEVSEYYYYSEFYAMRLDAEGDTLWTLAFGDPGCSACRAIDRTADGRYLIGATIEAGPCSDPSGLRPQVHLMLLGPALIDATAPRLSVAVFQNPYLTRHLDIGIVGSETLDSATVTLEVNSEPVALRLIDRDENVWMGDFSLPEFGGLVSLSACASDMARNDTCVASAFTSAFMSRSSGGGISSPDGVISVLFDPGTFRDNTHILVLPCAESEAHRGTSRSRIGHTTIFLAESATTPAGYSIGPGNALTGGTAYLEFNYDGLDLDAGQTPDQLYIEWVGAGGLESFCDPERRTVGASISGLGTFRLSAGPPLSSKGIDPHYVRMHPCYPNPSVGGVNVWFEVHARRHVGVTVFDVRGRAVARLLDAWVYPGPHEIRWDGKDLSHQRLSSGLYFIRLQAGRHITTQKALLVD